MLEKLRKSISNSRSILNKNVGLVDCLISIKKLVRKKGISMAAVPISDFSNISALFNLEIRSINGENIDKNELIEAIKSDVSQHLPISKTAVFKHFTGNKLLEQNDLEKIVTVLQNGVVRSMEVSHDAALSYAHAAIICASEVAR